MSLGSISRAANVVHVAQPALSQQIADLEERIGRKLLLRTPRGVRPTPAGEAFFREAASILHRMDQLPGMLKSASGEVEGKVRLGIVATLAPSLVGIVIEHFKLDLPKVSLTCSDSDSGTLGARVQAHTLDLALVFEDELTPAHLRRPIFSQRLFLVGKDVAQFTKSSVSLDDLAKLPLVLPGKQNNRRKIIDSAFASQKLVPTIVSEADSVSSELSAVRAGVGNTILNLGEISEPGFEAFARPLPLEPALSMTCSVISCSDSTPTSATMAVSESLTKVVRDFVKTSNRRGARLIG